MCIICLEYEKQKLTNDEALKALRSGEVIMSNEHYVELNNRLDLDKRQDNGDKEKKNDTL